MGQRKKDKLNKGRVRIPQDVLLKAIMECGGINYKVAEKLGISRQAVYKRIKGNKRLAAARIEAGVIAYEKAHANVLELLNDKDPKTSRWYVTNSPEGKKQGWGSSLEVKTPDGISIHVTIDGKD